MFLDHPKASEKKKYFYTFDFYTFKNYTFESVVVSAHTLKHFSKDGLYLLDKKRYSPMFGK